MSRGWKKVDLEVGTELKVSANVFQDPYNARRRLTKCVYLGQTNSGMLVDLVFKPDTYHYKTHINFANLYAKEGQVKIHTMDGTRILVQREKKTTAT